jgi:hypothetical protein
VTPIVLQRGLTMTLAMLVGGAIFVATAVVLPSASLVPRIFFLVLGLPQLLAGGRELFTRPPRLRADNHGIWFGGGATVPWTDVASVYAPVVTVRHHGASAKTSAIAFEFRRRLTVLRVPLRYWLAAPFSVGDVDVTTRDLKERAEVLAAKLESMRVQARGETRDAD